MKNMQTTRRAVLLATIAGAALGPFAAQAADYPNKPVRIVVPFTPGSGTDTMTRKIAAELQERLKTSVLVENLPGASGQIAASAVARAKPDGYTIFFTTNTTHGANPSLFKTLSYDPIKDFEPVTLISETPFLLIVRKDMPVQNVKELVAWLKANPAQASYGYGNSTGQVAAASLMKAVNVDAVPVPYKGTPAAAADVIGGRVAFMFIDTAAAQPFIAADGQMRALAITSPKRSPLAPEIPTLQESTGVAGLDIVSWSAVYAPAGTPKDIVLVLQKAIAESITSPDFTQWAKRLSSEIKNTSPQELGAYTRASIDSWRDKIKAAGIEPQ